MTSSTGILVFEVRSRHHPPASPYDCNKKFRSGTLAGSKWCCRLDTLRKVVPHRDRANTAAFLEEVISYVVGLKKRVADLEGVSEDKISVPQVDVGGMLNVAPPNGGAATVLGNPTLPTGTANPAETMQLAMLDGMGGQPMPVSGPIMAGMPFQDAGAGPDLSKGLPARGMPTPALNANQVMP